MQRVRIDAMSKTEFLDEFCAYLRYTVGLTPDYAEVLQRARDDFVKSVLGSTEDPRQMRLFD